MGVCWVCNILQHSETLTWGMLRQGKELKQEILITWQNLQALQQMSVWNITLTLLWINIQMGKLEDNLVGIFNLFDADGNKVITLNELYEMMAVMIEIGEGKDHKVDLAKTLAEMFQKADINKDEVMDLKEFQRGVMDHPVTGKIFQIKKIDAILELM